MSSLAGLIGLGVKVGLGVYRKVKGDTIPSAEEKSAEKQTKKLDKQVEKRGTPQDKLAALNAHIHLETLREARHRRLLAHYQEKGDMQKAHEEEVELAAILKRKEGYLQQLHASSATTHNTRAMQQPQMVMQGYQSEQRMPPAYQYQA
jgi:uncharacterized protein YpuA (DUF1002 family)